MDISMSMDISMDVSMDIAYRPRPSLAWPGLTLLGLDFLKDPLFSKKWRRKTWENQPEWTGKPMDGLETGPDMFATHQTTV